jgi:hypothetical protein
MTSDEKSEKRIIQKDEGFILEEQTDGQRGIWERTKAGGTAYFPINPQCYPVQLIIYPGEELERILKKRIDASKT